MTNQYQAVFGGEEAIRVWKKGDIGCSIQPVNGEESLCFWRLAKAAGNGAFVLGVSSLGKYFDGTTGHPTPYGFESCRTALRVMGFSSIDTFALRRLLDAIYEGIDELIKTKPPAPQGIDLSGVEKLTLRADGDIISEIEG